MNFSLLQLVGKLFSLFVVSSMSVFNIGNYSEKEINVQNLNTTIDLSVVNTITKYPVVIKYNSKIPKNISTVVTEGVDGISYTEKKNIEKTSTTKIPETSKVIQEVVTEVIEKGTGNPGIYVGRITGYGPDCIGCSGVVACKTKDKKNFSLINDGIYYNDEKFGKVRIVAGAKDAFPCGTIIKVQKTGIEPYFVIVMDRGATMNNEWAAGKVHLDLAYSTQKDKTIFEADGLTGSNMTFSVQRWGW